MQRLDKQCQSSTGACKFSKKTVMHSKISHTKSVGMSGMALSRSSSSLESPPGLLPNSFSAFCAISSCMIIQAASLNLIDMQPHHFWTCTLIPGKRPIAQIAVCKCHPYNGAVNNLHKLLMTLHNIGHARKRKRALPYVLAATEWTHALQWISAILRSVLAGQTSSQQCLDVAEASAEFLLPNAQVFAKGPPEHATQLLANLFSLNVITSPWLLLMA